MTTWLPTLLIIVLPLAAFGLGLVGRRGLGLQARLAVWGERQARTRTRRQLEQLAPRS